MYDIAMSGRLASVTRRSRSAGSTWIGNARALYAEANQQKTTECKIVFPGKCSDQGERPSDKSPVLSGATRNQNQNQNQNDIITGWRACPRQGGWRAGILPAYPLGEEADLCLALVQHVLHGVAVATVQHAQNVIQAPRER
jgi:hypothetical protein